MLLLNLLQDFIMLQNLLAHRLRTKHNLEQMNKIK